MPSDPTSDRAMPDPAVEPPARDAAAAPSDGAAGPARPAPARSLTGDLRTRDDAALAALLRARPDLTRPAPGDLGVLAARLLTPASVRRAIEALDTAHLHTLEAALVVDEPVTPQSLAPLLSAGPEVVEPLLGDLVDRALLWRGAAGAMIPAPVREALPTPAGLAPVHSNDAGRPTVPDLGADAPAGAADVLDRLTWGPATGTLDPDGPLGPAVRHLLAAGLLRAEDVAPGTVTLPRPVALARRGGRLYADAALTPPPGDPREHDPDRVDAGAGAVAADVLGLIDDLARAWGETPPRVLRSGGLAVRDFTRTRALLGLDAHTTALLIEVAAWAGWMGDDAGLEPVWAPTHRYDERLEGPDEARWAELACAWLDMPRAPHRVGSAGASGTVNALTEQVLWAPLRELRRRSLGVLADVAPGHGLTAAEVTDRLVWESPRTPAALIREAVTATLTEAEALGVTSAGALSAAGRALITGAADVQTVAAHVRLPAPVDGVILQADLTATAPGRLPRHVETFLRLAAELESRGGARIYRFSADGVRRLLDAGWRSADVLDMLGRISLTPVPQPLTYLVEDAARGHDVARVGAAGAYVTSSDAAMLDAVMVAPEAAGARLRRLAPTVLVSPLAPTQLLTVLRACGVHALAEGADGTVVAGAAAPARAPVPRRSPRPAVTPPDVDALVAALRAGEERRRSSAAASPVEGEAPEVPPTDPSITLALLRRAVSAQEATWIGVVGSDGGVAPRHVRPTRLAAGLVHGVDLATGRHEAWPVARISGVASPDADAL